MELIIIFGSVVLFGLLVAQFVYVRQLKRKNDALNALALLEKFEQDFNDYVKRNDLPMEDAVHLINAVRYSYNMNMIHILGPNHYHPFKVPYLSTLESIYNSE